LMIEVGILDHPVTHGFTLLRHEESIVIAGARRGGGPYVR
jgi:hypothetical protein